MASLKTCILIGFLALTASCGTARLEKTPEIANFIALWEKHTGHSVNIPVGFGDMRTIQDRIKGESVPEDQAAVCSFFPFQNKMHLKKVVIDEALYTLASKVIRFAIVAHELGHCVLEIRKHTEPMRYYATSDGRWIPDIMNAELDLEGSEVRLSDLLLQLEGWR